MQTAFNKKLGTWETSFNKDQIQEAIISHISTVSPDLTAQAAKIKDFVPGEVNKVADGEIDLEAYSKEQQVEIKAMLESMTVDAVKQVLASFDTAPKKVRNYPSTFDKIRYFKTIPKYGEEFETEDANQNIVRQHHVGVSNAEFKSRKDKVQEYEPLDAATKSYGFLLINMFPVNKRTWEEQKGKKKFIRNCVSYNYNSYTGQGQPLQLNFGNTSCQDCKYARHNREKDGTSKLDGSKIAYPDQCKTMRDLYVFLIAKKNNQEVIVGPCRADLDGKRMWDMAIKEDGCFNTKIPYAKTIMLSFAMTEKGASKEKHWIDNSEKLANYFGKALIPARSAGVITYMKISGALSTYYTKINEIISMKGSVGTKPEMTNDEPEIEPDEDMIE